MTEAKIEAKTKRAVTAWVHVPTHHDSDPEIVRVTIKSTHWARPVTIAFHRDTKKEMANALQGVVNDLKK